MDGAARIASACASLALFVALAGCQADPEQESVAAPNATPCALANGTLVPCPTDGGTTTIVGGVPIQVSNGPSVVQIIVGGETPIPTGTPPPEILPGDVPPPGYGVPPYPNATYPDGNVTYPDGNVTYPDENVTYPDDGLGGPDLDVPDEGRANALSIGILSDQDSNSSESEITDQETDMDIERSLLGVVLINHGADDVTYGALRDVTTSTTRSQDATTVNDVDREAVFSALALGATAAEGSAVRALEAVAEVDVSSPSASTYEQRVDLDQDDVLMGVILARASGQWPSLREIADSHRERATSESVTRDVDVQTEDALLVLTLGAGTG